MDVMKPLQREPELTCKPGKSIYHNEKTIIKLFRLNHGLHNAKSSTYANNSFVNVAINRALTGLRIHYKMLLIHCYHV